MNIFRDFGICPGVVRGIASVECLQQGWGMMSFRRDIFGCEGIPCGDKVYKSGLGTHSPSRIRIALCKKAKSFHAVCGTMMDQEIKRQKNASDMAFSVEAGGKTLYSSGLLKCGEFRTVDLRLPEGIRSFDLVVSEGYANAHASWADTRIGFADGTSEDPSELPAPAAFQWNCPVSFEYDGKNSEELFRETSPVVSSQNTKAGEVITILWSSESLRMKNTITLYKDLPVAEWHTEFDNPSGKLSGRLKKVCVLNARVPAERGLLRRRGSCHDLRCGNGAGMFKDSYLPVPASGEEKEWSFGATGGRPSDNWLPCFDLTGEKDDLRFVIGWAGQWKALLRREFGFYKVSAGMEDLDTVLEPGEKITQPSVFMLYAKEGGEARAANLWRRFVLKHIMTDTPADAPVSLMHWGGLGESGQLERLDDLEKHKIPYDVYWIDAGWFAEKSPSEFSPVWTTNVGDWKFDKTSYPDQLKNIERRVHKSGHKLLLWFEPERVIRDRDLAKEHPEYLIFSSRIHSLLDLGDPEAWQWCRKSVGKIIEENRIDWYREDFNFEPLLYWRSKDAPDRKGMTELRFVEGLYRFWKDLRKSYPGLKIDNCSSGGRRLDVELLRYSIPLWYSDMQCYPGFDPELSLVQTEGLAHYLPCFGGGIQNPEGGDTYNFRANYNAALGVSYFYSEEHPVNDRYPRKWLKKMLAEYRSVRELFSQDIHILEPVRINGGGTWTVFQYASYDASRSMILAFRPAGSPILKYHIQPRGLSGRKIYRIHDKDKLLPEKTVSGKELLKKGFVLEIPEQRTSAVILIEELSGK